jgi:simple sugar transport system substrate-binding protein/ribose transport system substrate-binding protein
MATVMIPFEDMGKFAVDAVDRIVVKKEAKEKVVTGPYHFMDAVLVDESNVAKYLKP